jgi:hypothetical protein
MMTVSFYDSNAINKRLAKLILARHFKARLLTLVPPLSIAEFQLARILFHFSFQVDKLKQVF